MWNALLATAEQFKLDDTKQPVTELFSVHDLTIELHQERLLYWRLGKCPPGIIKHGFVLDSGLENFQEAQTTALFVFKELLGKQLWLVFVEAVNQRGEVYGCLESLHYDEGNEEYDGHEPACLSESVLESGNLPSHLFIGIVHLYVHSYV